MKNKSVKYWFGCSIMILAILLGIVVKQLYAESKISADNIEYPVTTEYKHITTTTDVKKEFSLNGTASWYNDWVWLTPAKVNQAGNIYLNNKIQLDTDFVIKGKMAITFKGTSGTANADGIGMGFHTGTVNQLGQTGGGMGVVGLPNALAFVLDTYRNSGEPAVPYIGIWTTNASGTKTVKLTKKANLVLTKYQEVSYSFTYSAATRKITYQVYIDGVAFFTGDGVELDVPTDQTEYSFFVSAATGSSFNNQYVSIESADIPMLVTNTPSVVYEEVTADKVKLELRNKDGVMYPEGSVIYVNGTAYNVDGASSITVPTTGIDTDMPLAISAKSFKYSSNKKFDGAISDEIQYQLNNIDLAITSTASDNIQSTDSTTITGTATPNSYIRISDTPVNNNVTAATNDSDNTVASPISTTKSSITEFTNNFTVKADASGNYSYTVPSGKYFSAGSIIRVYALLDDGRHIEVSQTVLDKTPPTGTSVSYNVALNEITPTADKFVTNVKDTNPVAQNFSYTFNAANPPATIDGYMKTIGEYEVKVDVADESGNKTTITSKLIVNEAKQFITGSDLTVEYDDIKNLSETDLKAFILAKCSPNAYKIVEGVKTDLTTFIRVSDLAGLNDLTTLQSIEYPVVLAVAKTDSGLTEDISTTIKVKVLNIKARVIVQFINEVNTVLSEYTTEVTTKVGETINLKENEEVKTKIAGIEADGYKMKTRPTNETAVKIEEMATTVKYEVQGILSLSSVPQKFDFGSLTYNATTKRVDNPIFVDKLVVRDTRANATQGWSLTASLSSPMTNINGQELINAIRYVNNGKETILNQNAQIIYSNTAGVAGSYAVTDLWGNTKSTDGLKLQINSSDTVYTGEYVGTITWTIMAGQP